MRIRNILPAAIALLCATLASAATVALPGTLPATQYSAYSDVDSGSNNLMPGPDKETCSEGGQNIGYINPGEWLEFDVTVSENIILSATARVASPGGSPVLDLLADGTKVASCSTSSSGDWQSWKDAAFDNQITLMAGTHKLRVVFNDSGFNFQKLTFTKTGTLHMLTVLPATASFDFSGGAQSIQVTCDTNWSSTSSAAWLTVSPTSGTGNATVAAQAAANSGAARSGTISFQSGALSQTLSVNQAAAPNSPPTISSVGNIRLTPGATSSPLSFTIGDAETPVASLSLSASTDNPGLVSNSGITFGGSGANRTVTIAPVAGQVGQATITLHVTDTAGGTASAQFTVVVGSPILDRNGDGISDIWAALYPNIGGPNDSYLGDGVSNLQKSLAGLNPKDPTSKFTATVSKDTTGNLIVSWQSVAGKQYFVETSTDLQQWTALPPEISGTGATLSANVRPAGASSPAKAFWHVVVFDVDSTGSGLNDWERTQMAAVATITATAGTGGKITPSGTSYAARGTTLTYTVTPLAGYVIDKVSFDGASINPVSVGNYPIANLTAGAHTIAASFKSIATLTVTPSTLQMSAASGSANLSVAATGGSWTVSSDSTWLTVAPTSGTGNATVTVTSTTNTSLPRTAIVSVQQGTTTKQTTITQKGGPAYYFKNRWKDTYMRDAGDRVGYDTAATDDTYKWVFEDIGNGQKEIRNVGTGDYIHIQDNQAWAQCTTRTPSWTSARWSLEDAGSGFTSFKNVAQTSHYLHVENQSGYVQQGTTGNGWWSAQWTLESAPEQVPPATNGLVGNGIALFVPQGLDAANLPTSLALAKPVSMQSDLPTTWQVKPTFVKNSTTFQVNIPLAGNEDLYGTGEVTGSLRRNGKTITLWNTDNYTYTKDNGQRLYQSHPWVLAVRPDGTSFGVLFDSTWRASLTCSSAITYVSEGPALPVYVIDRANPAEVLKGLAELTGTMAMPPKWALGYQQCRYSYHPDSRVRAIADGFRSRSIPCDVIWMDIDYMDGFRVFTFRPDEFPDPAGLNSYLHQKGFKGVWMIDPGVKVDNGYWVYTSGKQQDVYIKTADKTSDAQGDVWPGNCVFPDFTRPDTRTWWAGLYRDFMAKGIDGVWNDMNEPAVFNGPDGTLATDSWHRGGGDLAPGSHLQYHNVYGMLMVKSSREGIMAANPNKRPFVLTRSNFLGGHRYAATWTGDNASSTEHMNMSVPMTLSLGLSGQPFNGPDLGGFAGNADGELWANWVGMGAFFPFCRGHANAGTNDKEPWAFGTSTENAARIALNRRYRLMPYLYTVFREASTTGLPVMRPAFMANITNSALRSEENAYLVGSDLMVVPRGNTSGALPSWPAASLVSGDLTESHQASLRVRPGAIIPLGKIIQSTTEESLDPLTLLISFDASDNAEGTLYEDAGDGYGYQTGDYLLTRYRAERRNGTVTIKVLSGEGSRARPTRVVQAQVLTGGGNSQTLTGFTGL
jgi:alpha-glucosidase